MPTPPKSPIARNRRAAGRRAQSDSDRVRAELRHDPRQRKRELGGATHRILDTIAGLGRLVDFDEIHEIVAAELAQRPLTGPRQLAHPKTHLATHVAPGVAMLPPIGWTLIECGSQLESSRPDQTWAAPEPAIVADHIGDVLIIEFKMAAPTEAAHLSWTEGQVARHLQGGVNRWGERLLGVATLCLGHPPRSTLTLPAGVVMPLNTTPLWWFPTGRLAA